MPENESNTPVATASNKPYSLDQIGRDWQAADIATLLFVRKDDSILLIRKKRGLGEGKINGPGGKLNKGESIRECAIREVEEELHITPDGIQAHGELRFQFIDGYSIHVHVYTASNYTGTPEETDEAKPLWFPIDEIPYEEMWEDDVIWLPQVLNGKSIDGKFIFDGDRMLDHELVVSEN